MALTGKTRFQLTFAILLIVQHRWMMEAGNHKTETEIIRVTEAIPGQTNEHHVISKINVVPQSHLVCRLDEFVVAIKD